MRNEETAMDSQLPVTATAQRPLAERLQKLTDADLRLIQGQGVGTEFASTFDNAFKNGFKNVV